MRRDELMGAITLFQMLFRRRKVNNLLDKVMDVLFAVDEFEVFRQQVEFAVRAKEGVRLSPAETVVMKKALDRLIAVKEKLEKRF